MDTRREVKAHSRHAVEVEAGLDQTRVVHDMPTSALPRQSVSTLEVLQDWQLRELRKTLDYQIGEDWSDD